MSLRNTKDLLVNSKTDPKIQMKEVERDCKFLLKWRRLARHHPQAPLARD
jgi:hypothetical protein